MRKLIIALTLFFAVTIAANAYDYNTGIGIRGGLSSGLTVKHFLGDKSAVEGILSSRWNGFNITGLYELHAPAFDTPRLHWYYGAGGHIGFWSGRKNHPWFEDGTHTVIGVDGIIGLEYNIGPIPFSISLDWKPAFNLIGYSGLWIDEFALSIRYTF